MSRVTAAPPRRAPATFAGPRLRICQVAPGGEPVPSPSGGGVESTVHHLASALCELGHEVTVIDAASAKRPPVPYRILEVGAVRKGDRPRGFGHVAGQLRFQRAACRALESLLREDRYDVVHFHGQVAAAAGLVTARQLGALAVFSSHNSAWGAPGLCRSPWQRARFLMEKIAFRRANGVICDSAAVARNLMQYLGVPAATLRPVPIGVDEAFLAEVEPPPEARERYAPAGGALVLSVARIAPYKNQLTLVRAMRRVADVIPEARLVLAGPLDDRRYVDRVRRLSRALALGERCLLTGRIAPVELRQLYALCDVFVLCSLWESQGLSVLEAMAAGRPVVASAIGPIEENVPPAAGVLVPPRDDRALADAIIGLLNDRERRRAMGQAGRRWVERERRWRHMATLTLQAYRDFAGKAGRAPARTRAVREPSSAGRGGARW